MSNVRLNFLNFRPDVEPLNNDGLVQASNVVHGVDGYKPIGVTTAGALVTTGALSSASAVLARPIGTSGDQLTAWITNNTLYVGINGVTATTASTGYPLTLGGSPVEPVISAFDVCELDDKVFFVATAADLNTAITVISMSAYMTYDEDS